MNTTPSQVWLKGRHFLLLTLSCDMDICVAIKNSLGASGLQESLATTTRRYHQERSKTAKWRREEQNPILGKLSSPSLSILLILQQEAHRQLLLLSTQRPEQSQQQFAASIYCLLTRRKHCPEPLTLIISLNPGNNLRQQAPLLSPFY